MESSIKSTSHNGMIICQAIFHSLPQVIGVICKNKL